MAQLHPDQTRSRVVNAAVTLSMVLACGIFAGCDRSPLEALSPAGPSSLGGPASNLETEGSGSAATASLVPMHHSLFHGAVSNVTGTCPDVVFTLGASLTAVTSATTSYASGTCSDLVDGAYVQVLGAVQTDGRLLATDVNFDVESPGDVTVSGTIAGPVSGACPVRTFSIGANIVVTNVSTMHLGGACVDLVVGVAADVIGREQPDGRILASHITIGEAEAEELEFSGIVASLFGFCPTLTFMLGSEAVVTNGLTVYREGDCGGVAVGSRIAVRGARQPNGTVLASRVTFNPNDGPGNAHEVEGTVIGPVTGVCPSIEFMIWSTRIRTSAATHFREGRCADLVPGVVVEARGTRSLDGVLEVARVEFEDRKDDDEDSEDDEGFGDDDGADDEDLDGGPLAVDGTVSRLRGACPNVIFNLRGTTVVTNGSTVFVGGTCSTLRPSVKVVVTGDGGRKEVLVASLITITRFR